MKDKAIYEALESHLSGVFVTEQAHRDMFDLITGGKTMKRKMTVSFVLALVLLTLSVTAVAAAIMNRVFEQVIDMELEHGPFYTWSQEERLQLLKLLDENGWDFPEDQLQLAYDEAADPEQRASVATRLISETFGREDALSHFDIIVSIKGPMTTWSLEDKAWYTDYIRSKVDVLDTWRDLIPSENDMSVADAVRIARTAIMEAFEKLAISESHEAEFAQLEAERKKLENDLASLMVDVSFFTTDDHDAPRWKIDFLHGPYGGSEYTVLLTRDGEVTEDETLAIYLPEHEVEKRYQTDNASTAEHTESWSLGEKATHLGGENGLPAADEIGEEQALRIAQDAMASLDLDVAQYTPDVWYKLYDPYNDSRRSPFYCVYFTDDPLAPSDVYCVMIDPRDGTVLETTHASDNGNG